MLGSRPRQRRTRQSVCAAALTLPHDRIWPRWRGRWDSGCAALGRPPRPNDHRRSPSGVLQSWQTRRCPTPTSGSWRGSPTEPRCSRSLNGCRCRPAARRHGCPRSTPGCATTACRPGGPGYRGQRAALAAGALDVVSALAETAEARREVERLTEVARPGADHAGRLLTARTALRQAQHRLDAACQRIAPDTIAEPQGSPNQPHLRRRLQAQNAPSPRPTQRPGPPPTP